MDACEISQFDPGVAAPLSFPDFDSFAVSDVGRRELAEALIRSRTVALPTGSRWKMFALAGISILDITG
jgi:hypothetical protein